MNLTPERILVYRIGQIGDTLAALPSLWALRNKFPRANIVVLSEIPSKSTYLPPEAVLPGRGLVDGFEKYPGGASIKNLLPAWRKISQLCLQGYDTLVYLVPSDRTRKQRLRDRLFFRLCGIRHFLGFKGFVQNHRTRQSDGSLLPLPKEADALLGRLRLDDLTVPMPDQGSLDLRITDLERAQAIKWWQQQGYQVAPDNWMAICVSGKTTAQLWPLERYSAVVRLLIDNHGLLPVIMGGNEDRETGEKLLSLWGNGFCAAGRLKVRESAALMKGARFYMGNNTGVMHLAASVGTSCVGISSSRDWPGIWEPYGLGHQVLRFEVPCSGCQLAICNQDLKCLRGIEVQQVYSACLKVLGRAGKP